MQADHGLDEEATLHGCHQVVEAALAGRDGECPCAHARGGPVGSDRRAGRGHPAAPPGVAVVEEPLERAALDEGRATRREALAVAGIGAERSLVGRIVDQREQGRRDVVSDAVGKGRPTLEHALAAEHAGDDAQQPGGMPGLEHHAEAL